MLRIIFSYLNIGQRGRDEARKLKWGDISVDQGDEGRYLKFRERTTKTRTGESSDTRSFIPKAYENQEKPYRCPVRLFQLFTEKRPPTMMYDGAPFYLAVNYSGKDLSRHAWYKAAPLGKNKLGQFLRDITSEAQLHGRFTNHAVRSTSIINLLYARFAPNLIQQMSGNKDVDSLKNYATASAKQQKMMSDILANPDKIESTISSSENNNIGRENNRMSVCSDKTNMSRKATDTSSNASMMTGLWSGANLSNCIFNISFVTKQN